MITLVTTCKGRLQFLKQTLSMFLAQDITEPYSVVVVDYGCPTCTLAYCSRIDDTRLYCLQVTDNVDVFNLSRARNCGALCLPSDILLFIDSDILMPLDWVSRQIKQLRDTSSDYLVFRRRRLRAQCVVSSDVFRCVRGYDEVIQGWGFEDWDFDIRCSSVGLAGTLDFHGLVHLDHSVKLRTMYYTDRHWRRSGRLNRFYVRDKLPSDVTNPAGYGMCRGRIAHGGRIVDVSLGVDLE